jgi:DNA-binding CsgD family transcriptional regulator
VTLTLSSDDLARLTAAMRTLLSPLEHPSLDDWGRVIMQASQELLGADQWFFGGPLPGRPLLTVVQDANGAAAARDYFGYYHQVDVVLVQRRCERGLEVHHCDLLYEPGEMSRDELYNDWCIPYRLYDTLGMAVSVPEHPTMPFMAHFYHERDEGHRFGQRGIELLHLLLPAFKAGVHTVRRFLEGRADIARLLDLLDDGLLLYDVAGRLLHQNAAATRLLAAEPGPDRTRIEHEARQVALSVAALLYRPHKARGAEIAASPYRQLRGSTTGYRLAGSLLRQAVFGSAPIIAVALARLAPAPVTDAALRTRFGLTPREIQAARLVAAGKSNADIAQALGVSPHTARRHTECIRTKMGVHSRAAVGARLRET